jgi:undecaprenyl-diphosphatase
MASAAAVVAGVVAFASTAFLMRYFRNNDSWALNPFAYYCIAAGLISGVVLYVA